MKRLFLILLISMVTIGVSATNVFAQQDPAKNTDTVSIQEVKEEMKSKGLELPDSLKDLNEIKKGQIEYTTLSSSSKSSDAELNFAAVCSSFTNMTNGGSHILGDGGTQCNTSVLMLTVSQNLLMNGSVKDSNFGNSSYSNRVHTNTITKHDR